MLKTGDLAPDFTLQTHEGAPLALSSLRGRKTLLWFYVDASTPDCTAEGCGLRDHRDYFDEFNIAVVGVSFNQVEDNAAFARKFDFNFPLLSDPDRAVALAYGACTDPKAQYPDRVSFLIGEDGRIVRVYDQVNPRDHAARVLADIIDEQGG